MTRNTAKTYCINVYESEKKKLKSLLKNVNKISLTTDCWKSKNQKIEYMVITGHWIDESWQLRSACLTLFTFHLHAEGLKLPMLFGVAWRIGASRIVDVIRDSVEYVRRSDARLKIFSEIVKQLNLPEKKLVDDCRTRWNSTYEMLAAAIKFKDVFPRFADRELHYDICPSAEDWTKAEKIRRHWSDIFIRDMVAKMKSKFDKYWGDSNLLMSIAAVLDPRCKLRALEFCFPRLYSSENVERQIVVVRKTLYELYSEYVAISNIEDESIGEGQRNKLSNQT
ncbi:UNVERIFIED_CONTAM: Zinc finger BED domain-containing protein RICESLEEPER 2 [Sesamum angustifolium]|uniref:Zinc finger BED domain-containing protein RICESLEEPER 2 n=1 Tax=Sesamum angustifolium TaxID=2727405 RepID=A0AAW2J665_9LAMI